MTQRIHRDEESAEGGYPNYGPARLFRIIVSILSLLIVALCLEMLLGISDAATLLPRLVLIIVVMACIVLRLGWMALIAVQFSLLLQEPGNWKVQHSPGAFWVFIAISTIVVAMKLPQTHRYLSDWLMELWGRGGNLFDANRTNPPSRFTIALQICQILLAIGLSVLALPWLPIGPQTNRWLATSVRQGQAFWPGAFWLAMLVACFVLAREIGWRMIGRSQSRLYLRSVKLIANYRDLARFERARLNQLRTKQTEQTPSPPEVAKPTKMNSRSTKNKPESKGKT